MNFVKVFVTFVGLCLSLVASAQSNTYQSISASGTAVTPTGARISVSINVSKYIVFNPLSTSTLMTGRAVLTGATESGFTYVVNTGGSDLIVDPIRQTVSLTVPFAMGGSTYVALIQFKKDVFGDFMQWTITGGNIKAARTPSEFVRMSSGSFSYQYRNL